MSQTATSPLYTAQHSSARSAVTSPSTRSYHNPSAQSSTMPPFFSSPRLSTPSAAQAHGAKTPSPNYFGLQSHDAGGYMNDGPQHSTQNWNPPSSAIHSTAAASPTVIPHDQNPEYEAFMRHSQTNSFQLGDFNGGSGGSFKMNAPPPRLTASPIPISKGANKAVTGTRDSAPPSSRSREMLHPAAAEMSQSPKRMLSPGSLTYPELTRRGSPATLIASDHATGKHNRDGSPDRHPRVKLPLDKSFIGSAGMAKHRAETLPLKEDPESQVFTTSQRVVNLIDSADEQTLILDLRVSTQYAQSHIRDALNLCIPTTLLKRPSFNVQKLAETFKDDGQRARFGNWRSSKYIIVYDNNSTQLKDATICLNMVKKFQAEGYEGITYVIRGGMSEFTQRFSSYVEAGVDSQKVSNSTTATGADGPKVAPVIGGCPMPTADKPANPFFGNIRQNMDLIGGVGQFPIKHPKRATQNTEQHAFPQWLKTASEEKDQGKMVSKRFEQIERREKKRMEDALSGQVTFEGAAPDAQKVQSAPAGVKIAGLGMGNKNRYNNIWPFEHSRVKLEGVTRNDCDYFNANYVKASLSHKRYISTQAPIPATFNDFWNVVWQQDVRVVVMLTAEQEGAQVKAHNYWDQRQYGSLQLEFLSEKKASLDPAKIHRSKNRPAAGRRSSTNPANVPLAPETGKDEKPANEAPFVTVRKFTLSHKDRPFERMREITQLQFDSWPDFGAPAHPSHLLGLVEQTEAVVCVANKTSSKEPEAAESRPVLVHCSAGCGRTGTFCTVSSVIDMLKRQRISRLGSVVGETPATPSRSRTSPMDTSGNTPAKQPGNNGNKPTSGGQSQSSSGKDFFGSFSSISNNETNSKPGDASSDTVEGSWINRDDVDLIEKTVEDFRHQRLSMVQSLRQFVLCYESIMEWLVEQEQGPPEVGSE
jgi:protein tyrosine phosphatase